MEKFYPRTIFEINDQSAIPEVVKTPLDKPLYFMAVASPKGKEEITKVKGEDFYKKFGDENSIDFDKYGQPLLQAEAIIKEGGTLLLKRVVAEDATLANVAIIARVRNEQSQKMNADGQPLYKTPAGEETTTPDGNSPIMENRIVVKYECQTTSNAKKISTIKNSVYSLLDTTASGGEYVYPLFILTDVGRGVSLKRISVHPNYQDPKYLGYMKYQLSITENNKQLEVIDFTMNPDIIEKGNNLSLESMVSKYSEQIECVSFDREIKMMISKIAELSGKSLKECMNQDLLFGKDMANPSANLDWINIDESGVNLTHVYGIDLDSGSNGEFGDYPINTPAYETQLVKFFNGSFSSDIYDLDNYKIDLVIDANYPAAVKREIEKLVTFREDGFYIRDLGLHLETLDDIIEADKASLKNRYCATYGISYDIIDPHTKKQIPVTVGYTLSKLLVSHFDNGRSRPLAGQLYDMVLSDAVEDTINFVPKKTPNRDEKQELANANINYAAYYDGVLTLETFFTSQLERTQLSYVNNVLALQEVLKAVRTKCPKTRYSFLNGNDLEKYKTDVQEVLDNYSANFKSLTMEYIEDTTMVANKVFYAAIKVQFRDFVQTEYFKIYAIN